MSVAALLASMVDYAYYALLAPALAWILGWRSNGATRATTSSRSMAETAAVSRGRGKGHDGWGWRATAVDDVAPVARRLAPPGPARDTALPHGVASGALLLRSPVGAPAGGPGFAWG